MYHCLKLTLLASNLDGLYWQDFKTSKTPFWAVNERGKKKYRRQIGTRHFNLNLTRKFHNPLSLAKTLKQPKQHFSQIIEHNAEPYRRGVHLRTCSDTSMCVWKPTS